MVKPDTMRSTLAILLTLMACLPQAHADDDCPTIDLENPGESASNIPVWDQGQAPYCYVYSASTLATAWIHESWAKENASLARYSSPPAVNVSKMLQDPKGSADTVDADLGRTCESFEYILAHETIPQNGLARSAYPVPQCSSWGIDFNQDHSHKVQVSPEAFESKMHELLTSTTHPLPYGIEFCSGVVFNPSATLITNRIFRPNLNYLNDPILSRENFHENPNFRGDTLCGFHTGVVVGQEKRKGTCYFRVRNSKGMMRFMKNTDHGDSWIQADSLSRNVLRLEVLSP
jgi:hypothetical protein